MVALQQVSLVAEERTIKGSYVGGCVPVRDVPRFIGLSRQGGCRSIVWQASASNSRDQRGV
jgi:Zn-dependent alcohol dehydrogenase